MWDATKEQKRSPGLFHPHVDEEREYLQQYKRNKSLSKERLSLSIRVVQKKLFSDMFFSKELKRCDMVQK